VLTFDEGKALFEALSVFDHKQTVFVSK